MLGTAERTTSLITTQQLFTLQTMRSDWLIYDKTQPYYTVAARARGGPYVMLVATNCFAGLAEGFLAIRTLLAGRGATLQVERQVTDPADDTVANATMLVVIDP